MSALKSYARTRIYSAEYAVLCDHPAGWMGTPARRERAEPGGDARGPISIGSRAPEPSGPDPLLLQM